MGEETERLLLALLRVLWLLAGGAGAFVLTLFVPPVALGAVLSLVAVALVRRRAGAYSMFTVGFAVWCAVYAALAVFGALTDDSSSGAATDVGVTADGGADTVTIATVGTYHPLRARSARRRTPSTRTTSPSWTGLSCCSTAQPPP